MAEIVAEAAKDFSGPIGALVDIGNNILNQYATDKRNQINRNWQLQMYYQQLRDARDNWNMVNEYNLPINQRHRLEEAGINPNLAFGGSSSVTAGNIGGSSIPSPTGHDKTVSLGEFYLRKKQVEAQIREANQRTKQIEQLTENQEMTNEMFSQLFNEIIATQRGDMYVKRIVQGWNEDHLRHSMDVGLQNAEAKRDLAHIQQLYFDAMKRRTEQSIANLKQEYDHLTAKYDFEKYYYDMRNNPYETSTILGFIRAIFGPISQFLEYYFPGEK